MVSKIDVRNLIKLLILIFFLLIFYFLLPVDELFKKNTFWMLAILGILFFVLGAVLFFLARKEKGRLKLFLLLTGFSAISPLLFSILHNVFYALAIIFENFRIFFEILHIGSFIIAMVAAPIIFIISTIVSMNLLNKRK